MVFTSSYIDFVGFYAELVHHTLSLKLDCKESLVLPCAVQEGQRSGPGLQSVPTVFLQLRTWRAAMERPARRRAPLLRLWPSNQRAPARRRHFRRHAGLCVRIMLIWFPSLQAHEWADGAALNWMLIANRRTTMPKNGGSCCLPSADEMHYARPPRNHYVALQHSRSEGTAPEGLGPCAGGGSGCCEGGHAGLARPVHGSGGGRLHQLRRAAAVLCGGRLHRPRTGLWDASCTAGGMPGPQSKIIPTDH